MKNLNDKFNANSKYMYRIWFCYKETIKMIILKLLTSKVLWLDSYISHFNSFEWEYLEKYIFNYHKLAIETGRWNNERKCNFCLELEDEFHFLLECKLYITLRKCILPKYYWNRPNMLKFSELISTDNVKLMNLLAKYVHKAFYIRNNYVNNQVR